MYTLFLTDVVGLNFSTAKALNSNRPYLSQFEELVDDLRTDRKLSLSSFDRYQDRWPTLRTEKEMSGSRWGLWPSKNQAPRPPSETECTIVKKIVHNRQALTRSWPDEADAFFWPAVRLNAEHWFDVCEPNLIYPNYVHILQNVEDAKPRSTGCFVMGSYRRCHSKNGRTKCVVKRPWLFHNFRRHRF